MIYQFDNLTIKQLKELTQEFLKQNKEFETPEELLKQIDKDRDGVFG